MLYVNVLIDVYVGITRPGVRIHYRNSETGIRTVEFHYFSSIEEAYDYRQYLLAMGDEAASQDQIDIRRMMRIL